MKRETWIDYAKAIGIFLVVVGHVGGVPEHIVKTIYSFHMPLFFFLSGYVYKRMDSKRLFRTTNRLLVRYVIYTVIFSVSFRIINSRAVDFHGVIKNVLYGCFDAGDPASTLWFLLTLYITTLIFALLKWVISDEKILVIGSTILLGIGFVLCELLLRLPLRLQTSFVCLSFFTAGWLTREYRLLDKIEKYWLAISLSATVVTICVSLLNERVDIGSDMFGSVPLFIIGVFSGITVIVFISRIMPPLSLLEIIGSNSIVIYLFHIYPVVILREVLSRVGVQGGLNKIASHLITYMLIVTIVLCKELVRKNQRRN